MTPDTKQPRDSKLLTGFKAVCEQVYHMNNENRSKGDKFDGKIGKKM